MSANDGLVRASAPPPTLPPARRLFMFQNGTYGDLMSGGDLHFAHQVTAAAEAGFTVEAFGGHALQDLLQAQGLPAKVILTDRQKVGLAAVATPGQQLRLFAHYFGHLLRTLSQLRRIGCTDLAFAATDGWFDSIPLLLCRARRKIMILGMDAPSLAQILRRSRPDVTGTRLASLHYCLSQQFSLHLFRFCRHKRLLYVHPNMRARLRRLGYRDEELVFVSNGVEVERADQTPPQTKQFDVMWIGRAHVQKGLEDLLATLRHLAGRFDGFRAVLVGQLQQALGSRIAELGLTACVHFAGFVSEEEKYRHYKASRVFLMPSRYESWGIVIGEALACNLPVVAYDIEAYRPVFGDLLRYVPPFDSQAFTAEAEAQVRAMREGRNYLAGMDLEAFKRENSWVATRKRIATVLLELAGARLAPR